MIILYVYSHFIVHWSYVAWMSAHHLKHENIDGERSDYLSLWLTEVWCSQNLFLSLKFGMCGPVVEIVLWMLNGFPVIPQKP